MVGSSKADLMGYTSGQNGFYKTDFTTGSQVPLGPSGMSSGIYSLALSPSDGYLYASTWNDGLWQINPTTGAGTKLSLIPGNGFNSSYADILPTLGTGLEIAFSPTGMLYDIGYNGWTNNYYLSAIDLSTRQVNIISGSLNNSLSGFAIDQSGNAIGVFNGPDPRGSGSYITWLLNINLSAGYAVPGQWWYSPSNGFYSLCYGPDGTLYGDTGGYRQLYTINTQNLSASPIGVPFNGDVPFVIVPEPAALLLLGLGAAILRRKKH